MASSGGGRDCYLAPRRWPRAGRRWICRTRMLRCFGGPVWRSSPRLGATSSLHVGGQRPTRESENTRASSKSITSEFEIPPRASSKFHHERVRNHNECVRNPPRATPQRRDPVSGVVTSAAKGHDPRSGLQSAGRGRCCGPTAVPQRASGQHNASGWWGGAFGGDIWRSSITYPSPQLAGVPV